MVSHENVAVGADEARMAPPTLLLGPSKKSQLVGLSQSFCELEIQDLMVTKKLGENTDSHQGNHCTPSDCLSCPSDTLLGTLSALAKQALARRAL